MWSFGGSCDDAGREKFDVIMRHLIAGAVTEQLRVSVRRDVMWGEGKGRKTVASYQEWRMCNRSVVGCVRVLEIVFYKK